MAACVGMAFVAEERQVDRHEEDLELALQQPDVQCVVLEARQILSLVWLLHALPLASDDATGLEGGTQRRFLSPAARTV